MAIESLCARLTTGQDASCESPKRKYYQQAVVINHSDIDPSTVQINKTDYASAEQNCEYNVSFQLKTGKKGYFFIGPPAGANYFGTFDKSRNDLSFVQYTHNVNMLVIGTSEDAKCILESLDKGLFVVALQFTDGTVEIYGLENGLSTGDYTYDVQTNGGGSAIILSSNEDSPENFVPLVYKSSSEGGESADFDSAFENPSTP